MKITRKVLDKQAKELNGTEPLMKVVSKYYTKLDNRPCYLLLGHNYMGYYLHVYAYDDCKALATIASALSATAMYEVLKSIAIFDNWLEYALKTLE